MSAEEEARASAYREQERRRAAAIASRERALAGQPAAAKQVVEGWQAYLDARAERRLRAVPPLDGEIERPPKWPLP